MSKVEFTLQGGPYNGNNVDFPESCLEEENPIHYAVHSRKYAYLYEALIPKTRTLIYKESFPLDSTQ